MSQMSLNEWNKYKNLLSKISKTAVDEFRDAVWKTSGRFKGVGLGNIPRDELIEYAYGLATKYGEASSAVAAEMYDAMALLQKAPVPAAIPAETATYSEVAKTVNGIIKNTGSEEVLAQGVGRLVKMAGTDTMLSNAYRDRKSGKGSQKRHTGAEVAWIPSGDTCPYCVMLASKGWQKQTEWGANNHSEHIHANCDCTYMVRFNNDFNVEGYDPEEYKEMYDSADGSTQEEKLNSMRREAYSENKEEINEQKRAAYAVKKEEESKSSIQDVTESYRNNLKVNQAFVSNANQYKTPAGAVYKVNGINIKIDHDNDEKETAKVLSKALGEKVELCPRVFGKIENVQTPDYLVGEQKDRWDRKALNGTGKDAMRDAIKRHRGQAEQFIVDVSNWQGDNASIINQSYRIFNSFNTSFVDSLIVTKDGKIVIALKKR